MLLSCFIGSNHMYILINPNNTEKAEGTPDEVDWEFAQKEIAQAKGFATGFGSGLSKGVLIRLYPTDSRKAITLDQRIL